MQVSAIFAFLKHEFPHAAESASYAERHVYGDPRASCFHARYALERLAKLEEEIWTWRSDREAMWG